jgi:hypothetical protein
MIARFFRYLPAVAAAAFAVACGDATGPKAQLEVHTDTLVVRAFTGASTSDATALNALSSRVVRTDLTSGYDVVFDLDQAGKPVLYPASAIANVGRAGLQKATVPFDQVLEAPATGYDETTIVTADVGDVYLIRTAPSACQINIRPFIYSKMVIDSVNTTNRTIHFRFTVDPNCGFRSFAEGIPDN